MLTPELRELAARYAKYAGYHRSAAVQDVERSVCGCVYGSTSWTTRGEAEHIAGLLGLGPGMKLLDVGSGSGWPGLYLAQLSGCEVAVVDLPLVALRQARERAAIDGMEPRVSVLAADAAALPFGDAVFDALSHSDVLCCTPDKAGVLHACRRVARDGARMVFTVIALTPALGAAQRRRAVASGPAFVDSTEDYAVLLDRSGWQIETRTNLTAAFLERMLVERDGVQARERALVQVFGQDEFSQRLARRQATIDAVKAGLLQREAFVACTRPAVASPMETQGVARGGRSR